MSFTKSGVPLPEVGSEIYVPDVWYLSRGRDDVCGGRATVERIETVYSTTWVYIKEIPGREFNWALIGPKQEDYREEYTGQVAHRCPDNDPYANTGGL